MRGLLQLIDNEWVVCFPCNWNALWIVGVYQLSLTMEDLNIARKRFSIPWKKMIKGTLMGWSIGLMQMCSNSSLPQKNLPPVYQMIPATHLSKRIVIDTVTPLDSISRFPAKVGL